MNLLKEIADQEWKPLALAEKLKDIGDDTYTTVRQIKGEIKLVVSAAGSNSYIAIKEDTLKVSIRIDYKKEPEAFKNLISSVFNHGVKIGHFLFWGFTDFKGDYVLRIVGPDHINENVYLNKGEYNLLYISNRIIKSEFTYEIVAS